MTIQISKQNGIARRRYNLWKRDPHCHWCKEELEWSETTIDHINQKTRNKTRPAIGVRVLSCQKCNNQRQIDEFNTMNKVQQWLRNGSVPSIRRVWDIKRNTPIYARVWLIYYHLKKWLTNKK